MISGHLKHFARTPIHDLSVLRFVIKSHTSYQWICVIIKLFGKFLVIYPGGFELIRCGSWADKFGPTSIIRWITFVVIKYLSYCRKSFPLSIDSNKSIFFHVVSYCLFFNCFFKYFCSVKSLILVSFHDWKRTSGWLESWERLLFVTDVSTTCAEAIFTVKW